MHQLCRRSRLIPCWRSTRQIWSSETSPNSSANKRPFHWANPWGGGRSSASSIRSSVCSSYFAGRPARGISTKPLSLSRANRVRRVGRVTGPSPGVRAGQPGRLARSTASPQRVPASARSDRRGADPVGPLLSAPGEMENPGRRRGRPDQHCDTAPIASRAQITPWLAAVFRPRPRRSRIRRPPAYFTRWVDVKSYRTRLI